MTTSRRALLAWYRKRGRADLPWRQERSPYRTLVSEVMLQQTQVDRVVPKFEAFMRRFPTLRALATANAGDVLREWKGLGYNARALRLHATAVAVVRDHGGIIPRNRVALRALPGVGPYTAAAIRAFAYGLDDVPVDVNIGRLVRRLGRKAVKAIGRSGYTIASALMDLGAQICTARTPQCAACPLLRTCESGPIRTSPRRNGKARSPFKQSSRYARGRIIDLLRDLPPGKRISLLDLRRGLRAVLPQRSAAEIGRLVEGLRREGLLDVQDGDLALP